MKTHKETFSGTDSSINMHNEWRQEVGLERRVQREIAQQVADALKNI